MAAISLILMGPRSAASPNISSMAVRGPMAASNSALLFTSIIFTPTMRTAWSYGVHGRNFVHTMLNLAAERDHLSVVDDQIGTPSWTTDIARAMKTLIDRNEAGIYHFTNEGVASWYDFADAIVQIARNTGFTVKAKSVRPISSGDFPTAAARPSFSVLSKRKIQNILDDDIPHWRQSLEKMLLQLHNSRIVTT